MENLNQTGNLFHSPLETGVRATVILNAVYPRMFDLYTLTLLDHLIVHTADLDGPESMHPQLPHRTGEMLVRRQIIEKGLSVMRKLSLVAISPKKEGIYYQSTDEAYPFVKLLRTSYSQRLKDRAEWLANYLSEFDQDDINKLVVEKLGRWNIEFQEGSYYGNDRI